MPFTAAERAQRAEARKTLRAALKDLGAKTYTKKKARRKYKKRYTRGRRGFGRNVTVGFPGQVTMGLGAYTAPNSAAFGESVGNAIGSFLPGPYKALAPLLGKGGSWLGNKIGSWLGLGAYQLNRNSIVIDEGNSPQMMHSNDDTIIVRHREYVGEVYSSATPGAFQVSNFALQPGNSALFEWLAPIANQYQEWIPMGMVAEFKSNSGEVVSGPTNALGQVIMATDYNAYNQTPFTNKSTMQNTVYSTNAKITQSFVHAIECDPKKNVMESFFVRAGPVPPGQPPQLYDLGTFAIASVGCQGASQDLGELWLSYEIGFRKASLIQTYAAAVPTDVFISNNATVAGTLTNYFRGMVANSGNSIGCTIDPTGNVLSFPKDLEQGRYLFVMQVSGSPGLTGGPGPGQADWTFTPANCTIPLFWNGGTNKYLFGAQLANATIFSSQSVSFVVDITGNNATLTADTATAAFWPLPNGTNGMSVSMIITQMSTQADTSVP